MNGHPLRCNCDIYVTDPDSPLTEGVGAFTVHDEHYQISDLAGDAQVFLQWDSAPAARSLRAGRERSTEGALWC